MSLVAERHVSDPPSVPPTAAPPLPTQAQAALAQEIANRASWQRGVIGAMNVAVAILAARMILLLAVIGAIALTWDALQAADPLRLGAVAGYAVTVVCPLVWLSSRH